MRLHACLLALLTSVSFAAEINLVAKVTTHFEEGGQLKRARFTDGQLEYAMPLDTETDVTPLTAGTRFTFQPLRSAAFVIQPSTMARERPIAAAHYPEYRRAALTLLPAKATAELHMDEFVNPLPINNWKSYRVEYAYRFGNSPDAYRMGVTFVTLENGQQIMLSVTALAREYQAAAARAESMIRGWYSSRPGVISGS